MRVWITTIDGGINYQVDAQDATEAFEKLAHSLNYLTFDAMFHDLDFELSDFQVATVARETREYDEAGNRRDIKRQQSNTLLNAFKHTRKARRG